MEKRELPFKQYIFVCTNARTPGQRISCSGEGRCGDHLLKELKAFVKLKGLQDRVRISRSGCLEQCEFGPNLVLAPQNKMLSGVGPDDLPQIYESYLEPLLSDDK